MQRPAARQQQPGRRRRSVSGRRTRVLGVSVLLLTAFLPTQGLSALPAPGVPATTVYAATNPADRPHPVAKPADGRAAGAAPRVPATAASQHPTAGAPSHDDEIPNADSTTHLPGWTPTTAGTRARATAPAATKVQAHVQVAAQVQARIQAVALAAAATACDPVTTGVIGCENQLPGTPVSQWDVVGSGDSTLQGFATDISANVGTTVRFKVKSTASAYRVDVYRLGYYQGLGARLVSSFAPTAAYPQSQPACLTDATSGLIDCGNWAESASWAVPSTAVSGLYLAQLVRLDTGGASHIPFVVRSDASHSDVLLQTSDETWEAYNNYGGNSLYSCTVACPPGNPSTYKGAYKVSYNRPFNTRGITDGHDWLLANEFPMISFLERNGYDVSYTTGVDSARSGALIKNHKAFLSVGHDEYWSGDQRTAVEAARDAGVNLTFFSGNEVFWKTRWEPSTDASATGFRTLVTYKDTHFTTPQDPQYPSTWTGTWRDRRWSPPADGGRPENALTGTIYGSDPPTNFALKVASDYAKLRFWRGTPAASTAPGAVTTLSANTLGYEFDVSPDDSARPQGLINLSGQDQAVQNALVDEGSTTAPRTLTHHLTLYRAPSGALVFGAGTVQWAFGLSTLHDGPASTEDRNMQQATVNLFADMLIQPRTQMTALVAAAASADTVSPTTSITAGPAPVVGTPYQITGTATDSGGVVAGVEVSLDSGASWHPAAGVIAGTSTSWSYTYTPTAPGSFPLQVRASDDSLNRQVTPTSTSLAVSARTCPCTLYNATIPATQDSGDAQAYELGLRILPTISGTVTGVRFYKSAANVGTHTGSLWSNTGQLLATGTFTAESVSGWQTLTFASPVAVTANTTYVASYHTDAGHYADEPSALAGKPVYSAPLLAPADGAAGANAVFHAGASGFPTDTFGSTSYGVDFTFNGDTSTDAGAPTLLTATPLDRSSSLPLSTTVAASFNKPIAAVSFSLTPAAGAAMPARVVLTQGGTGASLTPSSPLAPGTTYTASIQVSDTAGHAMAAAATWSFRTGASQPAPGSCPCTVWSDQQQPAVASSNDAGAAEFGVKLRASANGYIAGVRFFKGAQNTGVHTGELWSATGTLLATAQFSAETSAGWQQVQFTPAVAVTAGTTYVASYHTNVGYYAANSGYFAAAGTTYGPLTALRDGLDGGNGVYAYNAARTFPSASYGSANYWVDAVYQSTPPPATPPQALSTTPAAGASTGAINLPLSVVFDQSVTPSTVVMTASSASGAAVNGTVTYDSSSHTASFQPTAPLQLSTSYTATVGATATTGIAMSAPYSWSFTTPTPRACPCTLFATTSTPATASSADTTAFELGVRVTSDQSGVVRGVRFYKGTGNTGTHTGTLWTSGGQQLASGTFTGETASGWQSLLFDAPVAITAGVPYVASYHTDTGHYAYDSGLFSTARDASPLHAPASSAAAPNGVYSSGASAFPGQTYGAASYGVDVDFALPTADTTPPRLTSVAPTGIGALVGSVAAADFSKPIDPTSLVMTMSGGGSAVTGSTSYAAASRTATFTPSAPLTVGVSYTASVQAADLAGNLLAQPATWTFTIVAASTLLGSAIPAVASSGDTNSIELGLRFSADRNGQVLGVRFFKGSGNTGTHTGTLWSPTGTVLATGTFTSESATGWQTLTFASPVSITAGTVYTASYLAPNGNYPYTSADFAAGRNAPPLHATSNNDAYAYGAGGLPTNTYNNTNYFVDVIFQ